MINSSAVVTLSSDRTSLSSIPARRRAGVEGDEQEVAEEQRNLIDCWGLVVCDGGKPRLRVCSR